MIAWMWPGAVAAGVIGLMYAAARPFAPTRRLLPEISLVVAFVLATALGLAPLDATRGAMWAAALWSARLFGPVALAIAWTRLRAPSAEPAHAGEAAALGLLLGGIPAAALVVPRARDASHAARLAVLATATSAVSPVGGPAQLLLADVTYPLWAALPALAVAVIAWPRADEPSLRGVTWRAALPGLLGIPFALLVGGMAGAGAYAAGAIGGPKFGPGAAPDALAEARPVRLALAAFVLTALLHLAGIPWGAGWMADLGDRVPVLPVAIASVAAVPALIIDPFLAAALADRIVSQPSAPPDLAPLLALPLALCPAPAVAIAAVAKGWRVWLLGLPLTLAAAGLAIGWVALTR